MAMINCPECGQEISDKAKKCIHCGKVFVEEEIIKEEIEWHSLKHLSPKQVIEDGISICSKISDHWKQ